MNELISLFNYWIQFCKRVLDSNYSLLFYDLCLFASSKYQKIIFSPLLSWKNMSNRYDLPLLPRNWDWNIQRFFAHQETFLLASVLVFGMSHNIMFLLCITKGQKILFLFKENEKLSSVCILKDERVRKYCSCSLKMKRFSSILYDWMMIDRTHNWLRSFLKEYAYFYARLWNIKNYEVIPKQKRIIFRMILISDYECSSRIIYWFYAQN